MATIDGSYNPFARLTVAMILGGIVLCLVAWASTGVARAATSYVFQGESGSGVLGDVPTDVAIDDSAGYVLVVDSENDRVVVFESSQPGASVVTTFGEGELSSPYGIAIDQSNADVYVSDAGHDRIVRYTSDGATPPTYTLDGTYASPAKGTGAEEVGDFASTLAVDPGNGDLLVADRGNLRVERFDSSGAFVESFDGSDSDAGAFTSLLDIATAPDSSIYLIANGIVEPDFGYVENSVVDKFAADGTFVETLAPGELGNARALDYDAHLDNVLVTNGGSVFEGRNILLRAVHNGQLVGSYEMFTAEECTLSVGVAVPSDPSAPLSILTARDVPLGCGVASLLSAKGIAVDVSLNSPTAVTGSSAHLSGTVNPHGESGSAHFEYRRAGAASWTSNPDIGVSGEGPQPVEEDLTGLLANESYEVRLSANVSGVSETSPAQTFHTSSVAPSVQTEEATGISASTAYISGSVNPNGTATTFFFEYGESAAYGTRIPLTAAPAGAGQTALRFSRQIGSLTPGQTYHFRVVAENSAGRTEGEDRSFVAAGTNPLGRAYEQVTPVDAHDRNIDPSFGALALPDGLGISYIEKPVGGPAEGAPFQARLLSLRGATDWDAPIYPDPPLQDSGLRIQKGTLAISNDASHALVATNAVLAPGAQAGPEVGNLYVEDLNDHSYEYVATSTGPRALENLTNIGAFPEAFMGGNRDFSSIVFRCSELVQGTPEWAIYRWTSSDGIELISRLPDGSIPSTPIQRPENPGIPRHWVSSDASRVLFGLAGGPAYMRSGDETVPISVSEIDGEEKPAKIMGLDVDGRYAFFSSESVLVPGAAADPGALYRYDVEDHSLEYIGDALYRGTEGEPFLWIFGISPDGRSVAYARADRSIPFAEPIEFISWHDGATTVLKKYDAYYEVFIQSLQFSPNGRYFIYSDAPHGWSGATSLNEYTGDVYRYDVITDEGACVSCLDGSPTKSAFLPSGEKIVNNRLPRSVTDSEVFFDSSAALVPQDTNGALDVYAYREGHVELVTPGTGPFPSYLMDVSEEGRDVYFATEEPLVARDTNRDRDIYDARLGGGLPSQNQLPAAACAGEGCQGPGSSGQALPAIASEVVPAVPKTKHKRVHCKKGSVKVKGRCVKRKRHHGRGRHHQRIARHKGGSR